MLQRIKKAPINILSRSNAPKTQQIAITDMREKPVKFLNSSARASTLAPAIILLPLVPSQKFSFLFNPPVLDNTQQRAWVNL